MSAQLLPFPLARRADLVRRQAQHVATRRSGADNKYLQRQLEVQAETLERRGFTPEVIAREISALEGAIRAKAWHLVMRQDGVA